MPNADGTMTPYEYRKLHHRCVRCNVQDAFTLNGHARCAQCMEADRKRYEAKKGPELTRYLENMRHIREQKRTEAGMCPRCGIRPPEAGRRRCAVCNAYSREIYRNTRQAEKPIHQNPPWYCTRCHKEPPIEGKKLCQSCYEKVCEIIKKTREAAIQTNGSHVWREYWNKKSTEGEENEKVET